MDSQKTKILQRFFSKSYSESDLKNLFFWLNSDKGNKEINDSLDKNWKLFENDDAKLQIDSVKMYSNIKQRIKKNKAIELKIKVRKLLPYAAMLALIISFATVFTLKINNKYTEQLYTSVITENGQRSKVILPDNSIVWLNSGTTLSYNYSLEDTRSIIIDGQGFFQVKRNENRPFVVQSGDIKVKVLGTMFDVNAYPENNKISVVLEAGSVLLTHHCFKLNYVLKPGEQADYNIEKKEIKIHNTDVEKYTSWKNGVLIFRNDPMKQVILKLKRWYNIDIEVKDPEVYNSIFTGTVINESYQQIFRLIEYSCSVNYEIVNSSDPRQIPKIVLTSKK